jgi:hypothetical protein
MFHKRSQTTGKPNIYLNDISLRLASVCGAGFVVTSEGESPGHLGLALFAVPCTRGRFDHSRSIQDYSPGRAYVTGALSVGGLSS